MVAKPIGYELSVMKRITLFSLIAIAVVSLSQPILARDGGGGFSGGGHFGGGGFGGGHSGGGFGGGHFGGGPFGGVRGGGFRAAPGFYGRGAYFTPRASYGGAHTSTVRPRTVTIGRSARPYAGRVAAVNRQPNRVGSIGTRNRLSNPRISTARNRESFNNNHVFARHDGNWHRDWDKHRGHFWNGHWWAWYGGSWLGLDAGFYPWDLYDYGYYPYDYYGGNPDDYSGYYPDDYNDPSSYKASAQSPNNDTVSGVQSQLAKRGYYNGAIDGVLGDETEAALARYQEDHNLSVTGTVTAATLQSLGTNKGN